MISYRGQTVAFVDRLGKQEIHNWKCLDCGLEMATNVHWTLNRQDAARDRNEYRPRKCVNCGNPK